MFFHFFKQSKNKEKIMSPIPIRIVAEMNVPEAKPPFSPLS